MDGQRGESAAPRLGDCPPAILSSRACNDAEHWKERAAVSILRVYSRSHSLTPLLSYSVAKGSIKGYSETQNKIRNATSNDPWGPSGTE